MELKKKTEKMVYLPMCVHFDAEWIEPILIVLKIYTQRPPVRLMVFIS